MKQTFKRSIVVILLILCITLIGYSTFAIEINKTIDLALKYSNHSRVPSIDKSINFTVEWTNFSWQVNESLLSTRWIISSPIQTTMFCFGSNKTCHFLDIVSSNDGWNNPLSIKKNEMLLDIEAQVIYVDYSLDSNNSFSEIIYSEARSLPAFFASLDLGWKILTFIKEPLQFIRGTLINLSARAFYQNDSPIEDGKIILNINKSTINLTSDENGWVYFLWNTTISGDHLINFSLLQNNSVLVSNSSTITIKDKPKSIECDFKEEHLIWREILIFNLSSKCENNRNVTFVLKNATLSIENITNSMLIINNPPIGRHSIYLEVLSKDDAQYVEWIISIKKQDHIFCSKLTNINIVKNKNKTIYLDNYCKNYETVSIYPIENIRATTIDSTITFIPERNFLGSRFTYIILEKENDSFITNIFRIEVLDSLVLNEQTIESLRVTRETGSSVLQNKTLRTVFALENTDNITLYNISLIESNPWDTKYREFHLTELKPGKIHLFNYSIRSPLQLGESNFSHNVSYIKNSDIYKLIQAPYIVSIIKEEF